MTASTEVPDAPSHHFFLHRSQAESRPDRRPGRLGVAEPGVEEKSDVDSPCSYPFTPRGRTMGLREDLQDLCAEISLAGETRVSYSATGEPVGPITPIQTIQQILAIRSHYNIQDNTEFVALFRNAVETPLPQSAILARFRARQNRFGAVQPVFIGVLIEISAHRELRDYLNSCSVSDWSVLIIREYLLTKPTLFPRELLLFLEEFGRKLATPPPPREQELPDGRVVAVQDPGRREGTLLASAAAHARRAAVSLRLTMAEAPEIAEHGDTVMAALRRLRVDPSVIETFQQANATLARPATKAELALSIDRFRAFLEEVLRAVRRLMEDQDPTLPGKELIGKTPSELLDLLSSLITVKERELFQKFFNFVSVEGSHTTSATTEEARLARNLTIEIAWYLLSRVGQTSTAPPSS